MYTEEVSEVSKRHHLVSGEAIKAEVWGQGLTFGESASREIRKGSLWQKCDHGIIK